MSMKAMNDIREMLCDELDDISRKGDLNVRDLDVIYKVTQSIASLDDIMISIHALLAESDSKSAQNSGALLRI